MDFYLFISLSVIWWMDIFSVQIQLKVKIYKYEAARNLKLMKNDMFGAWNNV